MPVIEAWPEIEAHSCPEIFGDPYKHVGWVERNEIHVPERNGGFRRAQPTLRIENLAKIAVLHRPARLGFAERGAGFGEAAQ